MKSDLALHSPPPYEQLFVNETLDPILFDQSKSVRKILNILTLPQKPLLFDGLQLKYFENSVGKG